MKTVWNSSKQTCWCILMWKDNRGWTFSLEEALLWITDLYLSRRNSLNLKCCNDGFVSYKHIFLLQKTLIDELKLDYLDYCDVSISCLDSHSDGTHSLKRMHWWASDCNAKLLQICSDKQTNLHFYISESLRAGNIKHIFILGELFP